MNRRAILLDPGELPFWAVYGKCYFELLRTNLVRYASSITCTAFMAESNIVTQSHAVGSGSPTLYAASTESASLAIEVQVCDAVTIHRRSQSFCTPCAVVLVGNYDMLGTRCNVHIIKEILKCRDVCTRRGQTYLVIGDR